MLVLLQEKSLFLAENLGRNAQKRKEEEEERGLCEL